MQLHDKKHPPTLKSVPHMIHGGDYNPDQWLNYPDVLKEDVRLMNLAGINSASVAIFAWQALEPEEGVYTFEWLDETMDRLHAGGVSVILATPSGARPAWMDAKYPEVLRVSDTRVKNLHGERHNHCYTSPYYRQKVHQMNQMLANRYKDHPALTMWHLSNEYGGECHCENCQKAFRDWLRVRYEGDIQKLNAAWWTYFWSHAYTSFDQIESPSPQGESRTHGLNLDWKRFVSAQTTSFIQMEADALKAITPDIPTCTNLMGFYEGLDPWVMRNAIDVISWDNYPTWHNDTEATADIACRIGFVHDLNRSLLQKPFFLMESTPSNVNWQPVNKLKRPGMHLLSSIQAVAHGSDSVQYFQFRKSRGASEKFHGAVVDHVGHEHTRVFSEVAQVGQVLKKLDGVVGTGAPAKAAVIYDWENRWAIDDLQSLNQNRNYPDTCVSFYHSLWKRGISTDVIEMTESFDGYQLLVAPMLYMLKPGVSDRLKSFVAAGGTLVLSYCTGYVNESDLCFQGGFPGEGLQAVTGIWAEEIDALFPQDRNHVVFKNNSIGATGCYEVYDYCELIHPADGCEVLATYGDDFYKGRAAITKNQYGKGNCYYFAARTGTDAIEAVLDKVIANLSLAESALAIPEGVSVTHRVGDGDHYRFYMNFSELDKTVLLPTAQTDLMTDNAVSRLDLKPYELVITKE